MKKIIDFERICNDPDGMRYKLLEEYLCVVPLLGYLILLEKGMKSDGATYARDLGVKETGWRWLWARIISWIMHSPVEKKTAAWWAHDKICNTGRLPNGQRCSNFVASLILLLVLFKDGYKREAFTWFFATFLKGGGEARKNGMFWVKNDDHDRTNQAADGN